METVFCCRAKRAHALSPRCPPCAPHPTPRGGFTARRLAPDGAGRGGGLTSGAKLGARGRVLLLPPAERMGGRGRPVLPSARAHLRRSLLGDGAGSHGGGGGTAGVGEDGGEKEWGGRKETAECPPPFFF